MPYKLKLFLKIFQGKPDKQFVKVVPENSPVKILEENWLNVRQSLGLLAKILVMLQLRLDVTRLELLIFKIVTTNLNVISKLKNLYSTNISYILLHLEELKLPEHQNWFPLMEDHFQLVLCPGLLS